MSHPATTVILARHGRTAWHHPNRYAGSTDVPLDEVGTAQAVALARAAALLCPTSLVSSPQVRATATANPVAEATGLPVRVDVRFREVDFGVAEGRTLEALRAEQPEMVARFLDDPAAHHFPGGEAPADAVRRGHAALRDLLGSDPGGTILVVAHNTLIRLLVCTILGIPMRDYRRKLPRHDPVASTRLSFSSADGTAGTLLAYNAPLPGGAPV